MRLEHRNLLIDTIPKLLPRPDFENDLKAIGHAEVLTRIREGASYQQATTFILDAAIQEGWVKDLNESLGRRFPKRPEFAEISAALTAEADARPTTSAPATVARKVAPTPDPVATDYRSIAKWAVVAVLVVTALEYLNRHYLAMLVLYPGMRNAGSIWAAVLALSAFAHALGYPSKRWDIGLGAWLALVVAVYLLDGAMKRSPYIDPTTVEGLLPFLYGGSFGALSWALTAAFGVARSRRRPRADNGVDQLIAS